jgi:hypothetical protein
LATKVKQKLEVYTMENLKLVELNETEIAKINGGIILANTKIIEWIDKGLRAAGVYEFLEGVNDGLQGCGCD